MKSLLCALVAHLRENRGNVVRSHDVKVECWDPTYGASDQSTTIEVVDFDLLLQEIDAFVETFHG